MCESVCVCVCACACVCVIDNRHRLIDYNTEGCEDECSSVNRSILTSDAGL